MKGTEFERLMEIYTGEEHRSTLKSLARLILPESESIIERFYNEVMTLPEARGFVDNETVKTRLEQGFLHWFNDLLTLHTEDEVQRFIKRQREVGDIHARICLPISLLNHGMRILKRECTHCLLQSPLSCEQTAQAAVLLDELLDYSAALMNESYLHDVIVNERSAQSLRINTASHNLAMECERLRSLLFDWQRLVVTQLSRKCNGDFVGALPRIHNSDFGLWMIYKADLLFADYQELIAKLNAQVERIDTVMQQAVALCDAAEKDSVRFNEALIALNEPVTHAGWMLSSFVEHAMALENGRDPLTRLFNRRYIPTIMQRAISINRRHKIPFSILLLDIDHFKYINDTYGHDTGDAILTGLGEFLALHVRAGDFVFRYGGEEFLVMLSNVGETIVANLAEKLRRQISEHTFILASGPPLQITVSIGVAVHREDPDYESLITEADQALYQAKAAGRNRVVQVSRNSLPD